jgi:hypothetical protein
MRIRTLAAAFKRACLGVADVFAVVGRVEIDAVPASSKIAFISATTFRDTGMWIVDNRWEGARSGNGIKPYGKR